MIGRIQITHRWAIAMLFIVMNLAGIMGTPGYVTP